MFSAGLDYQPVSDELLEFNSGTRSAQFSVDIFPDSLTEVTEVFDGVLTDATIMERSLMPQEIARIQLSPDRSRAEVNILDDDGKSSFLHKSSFES